MVFNFIAYSEQVYISSTKKSRQLAWRYSVQHMKRSDTFPS